MGKGSDAVQVKLEGSNADAHRHALATTVCIKLGSSRHAGHVGRSVIVLATASFPLSVEVALAHALLQL
jgi:hypothetical protein